MNLECRPRKIKTKPAEKTKTEITKKQIAKKNIKII